MDLADFRLAARARSPFEAIDLGIPLLGSCLRPLCGAALIAYLPVLLIIVVLLRGEPSWAWLLVWWLKPWYDRCFLNVMSRAVFGMRVGFRAQLGMARGSLRGLAAALTVYRLDPIRSFNLPVWLLEQLGGRGRWRRAEVLQRKSRGHAVALTVACLHFEALMLVGALVMLGWLTPEYVHFDFADALAGSSPLWMWITVAVAWLALAIVEPLYVACGFALYLNRRIELEAWDLEISFRNLARRFTRLATVSLILVTTLAAAATDPAEPDRAVAKEAVQRVLNAEPFHGERVSTRWRWRESDQPGVKKNTDDASLGPAMEDIAALFKLLVVAVIGALLWWVLRGRQWQRWSAHRSRRPATERIAGLDVRRDSLPDDVAAAAREAIREGRLEEALSLLYRAALSHLVTHHLVSIRASATEGDCLAAARTAALRPDRLEYLERLTRCWLGAAYGRRPPSVDDLAALVDVHEVQLKDAGP